MKRIRIILSFILLPLSILYGIIIFLRNKFYDWGVFKSHKFNMPLVSVGNVTVGGTGKTPHVEYLAELLKQEFSVATLSRGYKRKTRGFRLAGENSTAREVGDEPRQIQQKYPDVTVAVDGNRVRGIKKLRQQQPGLDLVLLDDAYQHRKVDVNLSILLIDYNRPISRDFMLPLGNLREQAFEKRRANIIIITKSPPDMQPIQRRIFLDRLKPYPYQSVFFTTLEYGEPRPVFPEAAPKDASGKLHQQSSILLTTAIADPRPLKNYLQEKFSRQIVSLKFADHRNFSQGDIRKIHQRYNRLGDERVVITTEKDAIRLSGFTDMPGELKENMYYIPIRVKFLNDRTSDFNQQIIEYVRKNKKHNFLYPG